MRCLPMPTGQGSLAPRIPLARTSRLAACRARPQVACRHPRTAHGTRPEIRANSSAAASSSELVEGNEETGEDMSEDVIKGLGEAFSGLKDLADVQTPASIWLPSSSSRYNKSRRDKPKLRLGPLVLDASRGLLGYLNKLYKLPGTLVSLVVFKLQQLMLGNTFTKLITVFAIGVPLCAVGGILYSWASKKALMDGFIAAYGALYKIPGVTVIGEVNALTTNVMNILWIVGTFTFAVMLGFITEDITTYIMAIRSGNFKVIATNHTLVLNWTSQTLPLLRQIALNQAEAHACGRTSGYEGPVVILAEHDKEEMDKELRAGLQGLSLDWHCRSGAPYSMADLDRVAAGLASTVIMLQPNDVEDGAKKLIAAVVGVQATRAATQPRPFLKLRPQHLAVQVPDVADEADLFEVVTRIMKRSAQTLRLTKLKGRKDLSMLLAQSVFCPGLASVYCKIVQQTTNSPEFYIRGYMGDQSFEGQSYSQVRRRFKRAIVIGLVSGRNDLSINPPDDTILKAEDKVIVLAENPDFDPEPLRDAEAGSAFLPHLEAAPEFRGGLPLTRSASSGNGGPLAAAGSAQEKAEAQAHYEETVRAKQAPRHIVVTWWGGDITDLAKSLAVYAPAGSTITVLSKTKPEGFPKHELFSAITFKHVAEDPATLGGLMRAKIGSTQAIVIGGTTDRPSKEADAITITIMLLIQEVLLRSDVSREYPVHIVGTMHSAETGEVVDFLMDQLGKGVATAELLQPDELMAGVMAQAAQHSNMANLLAGFLYSSEGQELYLHHPERYSLSPDAPTSFKEVMEAAREQGDTALGYIGVAGGMHLCPAGAHLHTFHPDEKLVVIERRRRPLPKGAK